MDHADRTIKWINDALKQSRELSERHDEIQTYAPQVHQGLWEEVYAELNCLVSKAQRFRDCGTNGDPNDRILYKVNPRGGHRIELHIKLSKARDEIVVHGEGVDVKFRIDKMKDGTVGLTYNGDEETYEEAAKRIMKPFLFPELNSKS
jgi:hypothetical protein